MAMHDPHQGARHELSAVVGRHEQRHQHHHRHSASHGSSEIFADDWEDHDENKETICDYDTSATVLYELLESSNWEKARSRCRSHPAEARTWIVRKDRSLQVRWKLLPLHAAIIFQSPNFVVSALLEKYHGAASRKDDQGMLPLHLAFRHKQEDGDLLELLLTAYPKAVMVADKRGRVPLEHGRDSRFSAKLMRVYADATVAASRAMSGNANKLRNGGLDSPNTKTTQASTFVNSSHMSGSQIARLRRENDAKVTDLRNEFEEEIRTLKESHEKRLRSLMDEHKKATEKTRLEIIEEKQRIASQHKGELDELRDLLTSQMGQDRMMRDALENEVSHLHNELIDSREDIVRERNKGSRMKAHIKEVHDLLATVCEDHTQLQELLSQQRDDADTAQAIRRQLIETLLNQEESEGNNSRQSGSKMVELVTKAKHKIQRELEQGSTISDNTSKEGLSRVELERAVQPYEENGDDVGFQGTRSVPQVQQFEEARDDAYNQEQAREPTREPAVSQPFHTERQAHASSKKGSFQLEEIGEEVVYLEHAHEIRSEGITEDDFLVQGRNPGSQDKGFGGSGSKTLGDEISAITEVSNF